MTEPDDDLSAAPEGDQRVATTIPGLTGEKARERRQFSVWARANEQPQLHDGGFSAAVGHGKVDVTRASGMVPALRT
jgi:hypothetical protein